MALFEKSSKNEESAVSVKTGGAEVDTLLGKGSEFEGKLVFKMDEISDYLGREMTAEIFEVNTSTHYGRMVRVDDNTVVLFGNMEDMFEYI